MSKAFKPKAGKPLELAPALKLVLAPNPSPMTYLGTNTYLLGTRDIAVIDPGPPDEAHLDAIMNALEAHQRISHIFVTHSHVDHSPLAMVLAQFTGTRVHAFGGSKSGRTPTMEQLADIGGGEGVDESFLPDVTLTHGSQVSGTDWTLTALHTPGHMGNHLSFAWEETGCVFTGDLVMGWASSMVSPPDGDLGQFMGSLDLLAQRDGDTRYFPGHGAPIDAPADRVQELKQHRLSREAQIVSALSSGPAKACDLVPKIYADVDKALWPAAERNVLAHLIDLNTRRAIECVGALSKDAEFKIA